MPRQSIISEIDLFSLIRAPNPTKVKTGSRPSAPMKSHFQHFLGQYNVNLALQVVIGSQLRLRFEQKAKLLRKSVAQVARRDKRIEA
nr:hypothetical protein [Tanacetum cinerariifolium]